VVAILDETDQSKGYWHDWKVDGLVNAPGVPTANPQFPQKKKQEQATASLQLFWRDGVLYLGIRFSPVRRKFDPRFRNKNKQRHS
jgi:hypothetical protein